MFPCLFAPVAGGRARLNTRCVRRLDTCRMRRHTCKLLAHARLEECSCAGIQRLAGRTENFGYVSRRAGWRVVAAAIAASECAVRGVFSSPRSPGSYELARAQL